VDKKQPSGDECKRQPDPVGNDKADTKRDPPERNGGEQDQQRRRRGNNAAGEPHGDEFTPSD
jgi:hypothetical protein